MDNSFRTSCLFLLGAILLSLTGCGDGEGTPGNASSSVTVTGTTASVLWEPVDNPTVRGYYLFYGKRSPGQSGSCQYENYQYVTNPPITVVGLEPNTQYFFAVSTYNGTTGPCSDEVAVLTWDPV
jgi:hypothetical protein